MWYVVSSSVLERPAHFVRLLIEHVKSSDACAFARRYGMFVNWAHPHPKQHVGAIVGGVSIAQPMTL